MKFLQLWKPVLAAATTLFVIFFIAGIFDIAIAVLNSRFYSNAAFVTIFGVAGVFAAMLAYSYGKEVYNGEFNTVRWALIITNLIIAFVFFVLFAQTENGEYAWACRGYGITVALTTLFLARAKFLD